MTSQPQHHCNRTSLKTNNTIFLLSEISSWLTKCCHGKNLQVTALLNSLAEYNNSLLCYAKGQAEELEHFPLDLKNQWFVFKSVKSYGDCFLSTDVVGKVNWKRFPASATSVGRPSTQCENSLLTWLDSLSLNHRSHSPVSSILTELIKETLTTMTDWFFDGSAKKQEA